MRTKWEILQAQAREMGIRYAEFCCDLTNMRHAPLCDKHGTPHKHVDLEEGQCGTKCAGCGELLVFEKDFAAHFVVPDERYLNIGDCPKK